jgi:hypothetical protein
MDEAAAQDPRLGSVLKAGTPELREVVRNAFNLWLLIHLLDAGIDPLGLYGVSSEVQLLERYWHYRVESRDDRHQRVMLLKEVVSMMSSRNTLSVSAITLAERLASIPGESSVLMATLDLLFSDDILRKGASGRMTFSHNILFDFVLSTLLLDEEHVVPFIMADPSRSIFYRPSISYYFGRLWLRDRDAFWRSAKQFFECAGGLPARCSVIPGVSLFEAAVRLEDLKPLTNGSNTGAAKGITSVLRAINAFDGLSSSKRSLWIDFLREIADRIELDFVNEYVALISLSAQPSNLSEEEQRKIARLAITSTRWMWAKATVLPSGSKAQLLMIAASRFLPIILKFYRTVQKEAGDLVRDVLGRIGSPDASPDEPYWVAKNIETVIDTDPELVAAVYARIFGYREESEETTHMGGVVLPLTSTRAQEYSMAYYALELAFPRFLGRAPLPATEALVRSLNAEVKRNHLDRWKEDRYSVPLKYLDLTIQLHSDYSEIWDQGHLEDETIKLLESWFQNLEDGLRNSTLSEEDVRRRLRTLASSNPLPVVWKRTLERARLEPELYLPFTVPLLESVEVLAAPETSIAAGDLLNVLYRSDLLTGEQKGSIEAAILGAVDSQISRIYKKPIQVRDRLLGCIPPDRISTAKVREVVEALITSGEVPPNEPYFKIGPAHFAPFTEEDWLREQGVEVDSQANKAVLELSNTLSGFESRYLNEVPSLEECQQILPSLQKALDALASSPGVEDRVIQQLLAAAAGTAQAGFKREDLLQTSDFVKTSRAVLLQAAGWPTRVQPDADKKFDRPMWGLTPTIQAAQGLMRYIWQWGLKDEDVVAAVSKLSTSPDPAVRFQIAVHLLAFYHLKPEVFWQYAERMMTEERSTGVLVALLRSVGHHHIQSREPSKILDLFIRRAEIGFPAEHKEDSIEVFFHVLVELVVYFGQARADEYLNKFLQEPLEYLEELNRLVLSSAGYLPFKIASDDENSKQVRERARNLILRALTAVDWGFDDLRKEQSGAPPVSESVRREQLRLLFKVPDTAVFRLYLFFGANPQVQMPSGDRLQESEVQKLFWETLPIFEQVVAAGTNRSDKYLGPSTAHHLMQIFRRLLEYDPARIIGLTAALFSINLLSYQFDTAAISEVVNFTETVLADYREQLNNPTVAADLGKILDVFVAAGWPEATRIAMTLEKAIR